MVSFRTCLKCEVVFHKEAFYFLGPLLFLMCINELPKLCALQDPSIKYVDK